MYDPIFYMPMQTSIKLTINPPPETGNINISPLEGIALTTEFTIIVNDYQDFNLPLSY